jgi:hypothetical protein
VSWFNEERFHGELNDLILAEVKAATVTALRPPRHEEPTDSARETQADSGRRYAGTRVMLLVADRDVRVINDDGELLAEFTINPTKDDQPQKRPGQHA